MRAPEITCLFLDIGGVLLTDGWNRKQRQLAITAFELDADEFERRHHQAADTWEIGKMTMDDYLDQVVFHRKRTFDPRRFKDFMFAQSQPHSEIISLFSGLKKRYGMKIVAVSNEARELNIHRITTFQLNDFIDFFVSSCVVHLRKPDTDIFKLALEGAHVVPEHVLFIDNNPLFAEVADRMGMQSIVHFDRDSTCLKLESLGMWTDETGIEMADCGVGHGSH